MTTNEKKVVSLEEIKSPRYQVKVKQSVKGVYSWECTVETNSKAQTIEESAELVRGLNAMYPPPMTEGG